MSGAATRAALPLCALGRRPVTERDNERANWMSISGYPAQDVTGLSVSDLVSLKDRVAVVTGGGRGIGRAAAERLAEAGAKVLIGDLDDGSAEVAASQIRGRWGVEAWGGGLDVSDRKSVDSLAERADEMGEGLAVWVNNAGIFPSSPIVEVTDEEWARVLDVTLTGTFFGCRAAARRMIARPGLPGRVLINISSYSGLRGRPELSSYVAAKHGVSGLVRSLALELGRHGIRVLGIAPSVTKTPGMEAFAAQPDGQLITSTEDVIQRRTDDIPLSRAGVPDDVARLVLYCASDLSQFVNGVIIPVDGGRYAA